MSHYRLVTIDSTKCGTADSTSFPVGIIGTYGFLATVANGGSVTSSSGFDIIFCTNPLLPLASILPFERVNWSATTGGVEFYVQVPTLTHSSNATFYIYYGDSSITTDHQSSPWDSNFAAVYHFGNGSSLVLTDSTSNANNGTNNSGTAAGSLLGGSIGGSVHLASASSAYIDCGNGSSLNITGAITIEGVFNTDSLPGAATFNGFISKDSGTAGYSTLLHASGGGIGNFQYFQTQGGTGGTCPPGSGPNHAPTIGTNYLFQVFNGATASTAGLYASNSTFGDLETNTAGSNVATPNTTTTHLTIGNYAGLFFWNGYIDEVRISSVVRNLSWLTATFNNLFGPSTFYSIGNEVNVLQVNPADTLSLSDTLAFLLSVPPNFGVILKDQIPLTDGVKVLGGDPFFKLFLGDRLANLQDSQLIAAILEKKITDSFNTLADAVRTLVSIPIQVFDSQFFNWADAVTKQLIGNLTNNSADTLVLSDDVAVLAKATKLFLSVADNFNTLVDALRSNGSALSQIAADGLLLNDVLMMKLQTFAKLADFISTLADAAGIALNGAAQPRDTVSLSDAVSIILHSSVETELLSDTLFLSDAPPLIHLGYYYSPSDVLRIRRYLGDMVLGDVNPLTYNNS